MEDNDIRLKTNIQDKEKRIHNFDEVDLGYDAVSAAKEASRCLNCLNHPCVNGCPLHNNIPEFIKMIKEKNYESAYKIISDNSPFPSICSRVCSSEKQCEANCTRGIKGDAICISDLERFVCDIHKGEVINSSKKYNHKIAIVGGGPSGLACAKELAKLGYDITIFDSFSCVGGELVYGIPSFRLPKNIIDKEVDKLKQLNIKIKLNTRVTNFSDLLNEYECAYVSIGTNNPIKLNISSENLQGVYEANKFLKDINFDIESIKAQIKGKNVVVIGGGNVAIDSARSAIRLEANKVDILYRRTIDEMPANNKELSEALDEKITILELFKPINIMQNNNKILIECVRMRLGETDQSGRRMPIEIENSNCVIEADIVIAAIGNQANEVEIKEFNVNNKGYIVVDDNGMTNIKKIYAGGDIVSGPSTVVNAIKSGKEAAISINNFINSK